MKNIVVALLGVLAISFAIDVNAQAPAGMFGRAPFTQTGLRNLRGPKFRIARKEYAGGKERLLLIFASVRAKSLNCADMVSIVREIKMQFPVEEEIDVTFFTNYRSAKTFSIYPGSTDYVRNMKSMAAGYNLNRRTGTDILTYSPDGYLPKNTQRIDLIKSPTCPAEDRSTSPESIAKSCSVEYEDLIEVLFPRHLVGTGNGFGLVVRYIAPGEPEIQINLIQPTPGEAKLEIYRPVSESIDQALRKMCAVTPKLTLRDAVKIISVSKRSLIISDQESSRIRDGLFATMEKSIESERRRLAKAWSPIADIRSDGALYLVEFTGSSNIRLQDEGGSIVQSLKNDNSPLIRWAVDVINVAKLKAAAEQ